MGQLVGKVQDTIDKLVLKSATCKLIAFARDDSKM